MHPIFFELGNFTFYTYGIFVLLGVLSGYFVCLNEAKRQGIDKRNFSDTLFWTLFFSFVGARIFYVSVEFKSFLDDPIGLLISRSGFIFYGGIIFGLAAFYFLTKRYKIDFLKSLDVVAIGIPLAHALGRVGCFFHGCCYGRPTKSFIGVLFPLGSPVIYHGKKVIPTQLIEAFFLLLLFIVLNFLKKRKKFNGQLFLYYIIFYATFRLSIEFFRGDPRGQFLFLSTSQMISIILIFLSIFWWFKYTRRNS